MATRLTLAHIMSAHDTNLMGTVHGGHVMKLVDDAAGTAAARFSAGPAVTAAMDEMLFVPVRVVDVITVNAQVNWAGRTSMEVGAREETTRWDQLGEPVHVATAYLVMVAVDPDGATRAVPELNPSTAVEVRRHREAVIRRAWRLSGV